MKIRSNVSRYITISQFITFHGMERTLAGPFHEWSSTVCVDYKIKMATSVGYMLTYYNDSRCMAKSHMHLTVLFMINVHKKNL